MKRYLILIFLAAAGGPLFAQGSLPSDAPASAPAIAPAAATATVPTNTSVAPSAMPSDAPAAAPALAPAQIVTAPVDAASMANAPDALIETTNATEVPSASTATDARLLEDARIHRENPQGESAK